MEEFLLASAIAERCIHEAETDALQRSSAPQLSKWASTFGHRGIQLLQGLIRAGYDLLLCRGYFGI